MSSSRDDTAEAPWGLGGLRDILFFGGCAGRAGDDGGMLGGTELSRENDCGRDDDDCCRDEASEPNRRRLYAILDLWIWNCSSEV